MSAPERDTLQIISERLAAVLRRQDEIEARFLRIEAALGIKPAEVAAPPPAVAGPGAVVPAETGATQVMEPPAVATLAAPVAPVAARAAPVVALAAPVVALAAPVPPLPAPVDEPVAPGVTLPMPGVTLPMPATLGTGRATPVEAPATIESQVGLHWLNRIGVVTLILGVAFAFKTAADNGWIGPSARVMLGIGAALVTLLAGDIQWRRGKAVFAQGLTGLGLAMLYLSFWASSGLYHLLLSPVAFGLMIGTTVASALLALRYGSQAIAILAMLGGYITPIALSTGEPHPLIFLGYITLLNIGAIVLARRRVWPALEDLAAAATCALYAGWWATSATTDDRPIASVFAMVFYVQFSVARSRVPWQFAQVLGPVVMAGLWSDSPLLLPLLLVFVLGGLAVAELRRWREAPLWAMIWFWAPALVGVGLHRDPPSLPADLAWVSIAFAAFFAWILWWNVRQKRALYGLDLALVVANPAAYFAASTLLLEPDHHAVMGLFLVGLAGAQLALAKLVWHPGGATTRDPRPGKVAIGVALALVTLAVPIQFVELAITVAWALEGALLAWLSARFASVKLSGAACLVLVLALLSLFALDVPIYERAEPVTFANARFAALAVMAASLFVAARSLRERPRATTAYVLGHLVVLIALGLEMVGWIERSVADSDRFGSVTIAVSILMALYAVMLIALGVVRRSVRDRILGLVLMAIVVAKLYASDVWAVGRGFQVAAFLGLGALLLLVSYLYSRYRALIERLWKDPA